MILKNIYIKTSLVLLLTVAFFMAETTISFSDKANENMLKNHDEISFALKINNNDSELPETEILDHIFENMIRKNKIAGASVAVSYQGRIVYARGFGHSNVETGEEVQPGHLFRIASVSKLITAVAVMKLIEEGKLQLDQKVFGPDGILTDSLFRDYADPRVENITVHHLLNHTAGWSRKFGDPMFNSLYIARITKTDPPAGFNHILSFQLKQKLVAEPGKHYSYSNLGYALLGSIIESKTGLSYEDYVHYSILKPLGINDMHIGKSLYYQKFPNEVSYYEPNGTPRITAFDGSGILVPNSYGGNNMELLGAAGGWIASAPELLRFISAVDGLPGVPDILADSTFRKMCEPQSGFRSLYGWRGGDRNGTLWRTGLLSGSTALVMRMENGLNWVVLLNASSTRRSRMHSQISRLIFEASHKIRQWPEHDLYLTGLNRTATSDHLTLSAN